MTEKKKTSRAKKSVTPTANFTNVITNEKEPEGVRVKMLKTKRVFDGVRWVYFEVGKTYYVDATTARIWTGKYKKSAELA